MKLLVLGGGAQGSAAAFDLLQQESVDRVVIGDVSDRVPPFLEPLLGDRLGFVRLDAGDPAALRAATEGHDAVVCALPYFLNLDATRAAIEAGAHFCDLGGNTGIVLAQKELDASARAAGVSVIPDCGLAPGMVNVLAQAGIDALERTESVQIFVGGLPQDPQPPLDYQIVYSLQGVLDYYTTTAVVLESGEPVEKAALSGREPVCFPEPVGELEAFYTAGGISTMPQRYRGRIPEMSYKTLRYPGHAGIMEAIRELGLLSTEPVRVGDTEVVPRKVFIACATPHLQNPRSEDLVAMRVVVRGEVGGAPRTVRYDLIDRYDRDRGITAMMRTTGYSLSITALLQLADAVGGPGVHTPDEAVPAGPYIEALARRGIVIERSES